MGKLRFFLKRTTCGFEMWFFSEEDVDADAVTCSEREVFLEHGCGA